MNQAQILTLIEQAFKELDGESLVTVAQVQAWLQQRGIDIPLHQVSGNMQIVRDLADYECSMLAEEGQRG